MALDSCVREILCGLSAAVRAALSSIIQGYILQLGTYKATLEAQLIYLDLLAIPPQLVNTLAQQALNEAKAATNLIPLSLIGRCVDIGDINATIEDNVNIIAADLNIILTDVSRILSQSDEIQALIDTVSASINLYTEVLSLIDLCED